MLHVMPPFQGLGRILLRVSQGAALGWIKAAPLALKKNPDFRRAAAIRAQPFLAQ